MSLADTRRLAERMQARERLCPDLRDRLCADLGEHTRACKLVRERSPKLTPDDCQEMLQSYEHVRDDLASQPGRMRVGSEAAARLTAGHPPARGPAEAKLQLVEFVDFENKYTAQAAEVVRALTERFADQLRITIRMNPLPDDPHARLAAEAALAAHAQGKFWEMQELLLTHQDALDLRALERYAAQLQLDMKAFKAALDRHTFAPAIDADLALVKDLSITAMPAMFLNGERMLNSVDQQSLIDAADEYLSH